MTDPKTVPIPQTKGGRVKILSYRYTEVFIFGWNGIAAACPHGYTPWDDV